MDRARDRVWAVLGATRAWSNTRSISRVANVGRRVLRDGSSARAPRHRKVAGLFFCCWRGMIRGMLPGSDLRRSREAAGLLRRDLGELIGVNELTIRNIELGRLRNLVVEAKMRATLHDALARLGTPSSIQADQRKPV